MSRRIRYSVLHELNTFRVACGLDKPVAELSDAQKEILRSRAEAAVRELRMLNRSDEEIGVVRLLLSQLPVALHA